MADWPLLANAQRAAAIGANSAASNAVNVQSGVGNNTKGSWVELTSSSAIDTAWIQLEFGLFENVAACDYLFDIGVGASGSEQVVLSNVAVGTRGTWIAAAMPFLPVQIPSGTRIAARCQGSNSTGGRATKLKATLYDAGFAQSSSHGLVTTYGANTADSGGVSVDPGAVAHTKGSWSEITSSLTFTAKWCVVAFGLQANSARSVASWLIDIGLGAGGSEQVLVPNLLIASVASNLIYPCIVTIPLSLPQGQRVAVRAQCDITDATDRTFDAIIYGVS